MSTPSDRFIGMTTTSAGDTVKIRPNGDVMLTSEMTWNGVPTGKFYTSKIGNVCKDITRTRDFQWEATPGKNCIVGRMGKGNFATRRDAVAWLVQRRAARLEGK